MPALHSTKSNGFTLIEVTVTVAIVGLVASLAYPSYSHYQHRSRRSEAMVALLQVQQAQERWRSTRVGYANQFDELGLTSLGRSGLIHYAMKLETQGTDGYVIRATATGSQVADKACTSLTIVVLNGQTTHESTGTSSALACWNIQ